MSGAVDGSERLGRLQRAGAVLPGLALAAAVAALATVVAIFAPVLGGPVAAVVIGVVLSPVAKRFAVLKPGLAFSGKFVLQLSVVVLGSQLSLAEAARLGLESLPVMLGTVVIGLGGAWLIGRMLGVVGDLRTLIGVGTGICGASAIAAVSPVIGAVSVDIAYAVSTIFLFNVAAVLVFPVLGHALGLSQHAFGVFAGTAVNDTSSVVATSATYGAEATNVAIVVKLVRTLMIVPIVLALAAITGRKAARVRSTGPDVGPDAAADTIPGSAAGTAADAAAASPASPRPGGIRPGRVLRLIPWFLIGFVVMAGINSIGLVPDALDEPLTTASHFLITVALGAIGLTTDIAGFRRTGPRPLVLGGLLWILMAASSLGLMALSGLL